MRLSQAAFARRCGLSRLSIMRFEQGGTIPRDYTKQKIADALGLELNEFLMGPSEKHAKSSSNKAIETKNPAKSRKPQMPRNEMLVDIINAIQNLDGDDLIFIHKLVKLATYGK